MKQFFILIGFYTIMSYSIVYASSKPCAIEVEGVKVTHSLEEAKAIWVSRGFEPVPLSNPRFSAYTTHFTDGSRQLIYTRNPHGATITHNFDSPQAANIIQSRLSLLCTEENKNQKCVLNVPDMVNGKPIEGRQGVNTKWRGGFERISIRAQESGQCDYRLKDLRDWKGPNKGVPTSEAPITGLGELIIYSENVTNVPESLPSGVPPPAPHTSR